MTTANPPPRSRARVPAAAIWIPAAYAVASGAWIALSDLLVSSAASSPSEQAAWSIGKGLGFVAVTAFLLYVGIRAAIGREREALDRVSESEALYRAQFEEHAAVQLLVDPEDGRILDANHAAATFYGWPRERLREMRVQEVNTLSAEEIGREMERARSLVRTQFEFRHRLADGSVRDVAVFSCRIPVRGRELLHSIVQDVTEQKRVERALREKKDELDAILRSALDGFWIVDTTGRLLEVNDAACAMLGYTREELLACRISDIEASMDPGEIEARTREIVEVGRARFESRHRRKDGSLLDVEVSVQFLPFGGGHIVSFIRDVTARRLAEEQLRQAQKMEAVGRLAGGIAHDFNNLLTVILSSSAFALEQAPAGSQLREDVDDVRAAAEKARALTAQLLAFSRRQLLEPRDIDLNHVVRDAERILARVVGEHVTIRTQLEPRLGPVHADPGQMQQVLMNLAVNAQDAMPRGGTLTIETANVERPAGCDPDDCPLEAGSCVQLAVSDTGVGMDEKIRSHIFEPFFTTKPVGKGTGLGLSTVFGIVQQSRGTIRVKSAPGQGTRFEICFPRVAPGTGPVAPEAPSSRASTARPGESVLVVEDDDLVRRITVRTLKKAGFEVVSGATLEEALARLHEEAARPHVLLTDVRMPGRSGPEVSAALSREIPGLKTVFMSGWSDDELSADGVPAGSLFLQKPFSTEDLVDRIREAIGDGRLERQAEER
ncbi:MAG TPA: PAS domain S-box protein [Anaeromyxobacteraceae bacterium]|nr:PAS domain S-box protein [Anaeromyxobacteraceae bacterium]